MAKTKAKSQVKPRAKKRPPPEPIRENWNPRSDPRELLHAIGRLGDPAVLACELAAAQRDVLKLMRLLHGLDKEWGATERTRNDLERAEDVLAKLEARIGRW